MVLYLVLYLQDILGYSALDTGLRLLVSTGGTFVAAAISGRLSERVPVRYLIAPGLALVGVGLLLMSGINGDSSWTHLLPGFIVAGTGAGLVNPPLASTAIGVVTPERSGMASGVNSTFRQVGFAVSIAALGSIFASSLRDDLTRALSAVPALSSRTPEVVALIHQGNAAKAIASAPPALRNQLAAAIRSSFASGMDNLMVVTAIVALVGAVGSFLLIRQKDFLARHQPRETTGEDRLAPTA
jgi:predicted MFS family arabinose efflux permease